eukprot:NODE_688_length_748_cov_143.862661_g623_i0.p1 GENE.NODE_688_length_748_cov_143.862661_g623_i0~~NODE_688_length_748_cov_143.862661_g623_i0.p1  ORF type:complete len:207 (-),score=49.93 NODE_688_length_748_cov_143.862661_g623_i0:128-721(-)
MGCSPMKILHASQSLTWPKECNVKVHKRTIEVTGPRGKLSRDFKHARFEFIVTPKARKLEVVVWNGRGGDSATIKTCISHVQNMLTGVTKGFRYKMRFAYAHFPVNVTVTPENIVEVRNFLGEKLVRRVAVREGVTCTRTDPSKQKDELVLEGIDITDVSKTAASIHQSCLVRRKDIRKFLDGIYVSVKENIAEEED